MVVRNKMKKTSKFLIISILLILTAILSVSFISSKLEYWKDYDFSKKEVSIRNIFGEIVKAQLIKNTPNCINCHSITRIRSPKDLDLTETEIYKCKVGETNTTKERQICIPYGIEPNSTCFIENSYPKVDIMGDCTRKTFRTEFKVYQGGYSNYKETWYYLQEEEVPSKCKIGEKNITELREVCSIFGEKDCPKEYFYPKIDIIGDCKKKVQVPIVIDISKEPLKANTDYYILREATLKNNSLVDYIPAYYGIVVDEEEFWNSTLISFVAPTPNNQTITTNSSVELNVTITPTSLFEFNLSWNGTNYNFYDNTSLVLMMNFDNVSALGDNETYAVDVSQFGNNGVFGDGNSSTRPNWTTDGRYGSALKFDGKGDAVNVSQDPSLLLTNGGTISAWIYPYDYGGGGYGRIISKGSGTTTADYQLWITSPGQLRFKTLNGTTQQSTNNAITLNQWNHVVVVFSSTSETLYVDGVNRTVWGNETSLPPNTANSVQIGGLDGASRNFNGTIDEIRVWNRTLSADEIREIYNSNLKKYSANNWEFYSNKSNFGIGEQKFYASAKESSGYWNKTDTRVLRYSNNAPQMNNIAISPTTAYNYSLLNCSATYNDAEGDVGNVTFNWYNGSTLYWQVTQFNKLNNEVVNEPLTWFNKAGLVGYWKFSEGNGTQILDISGNQHNGNVNNTITAPTWNISGKYGYGLTFNKTKEDFLDIPFTQDLNLTDNFTIVFWGYPYDITNNKVVLGRGNVIQQNVEYSVSMFGNGKIAFFVDTTGGIGIDRADSNGSYRANEWMHIAVSYNSHQVKFYLNGTMDSAFNITGKPDVSSNLSLRIGAIDYQGQGMIDWFNGVLDEVMLFIRTLTPTEVYAIYNNSILNHAETWNCSVNATDNWGTLGLPNSTTKTIFNNLPEIRQIAITPNPAYTDSTLNCSATYNDTEGDAGNVSIYWYNGSALYSSATILNVLNGNLASFILTSGIQAKGETWNCTINATDSYNGIGLPNSTTITISNTPPEMREVTITPSPAYAISTLNCSANYYDLNAEAGSISLTWYNGSALYSSTTFTSVSNGSMVSNSLSPEIQHHFEIWNCSVNATDISNGVGLPNSTIINISNTAPDISEMTITPATAYTNSTLNCSAWFFDDDDGDSGNVSIYWYNGSTLYSSTTILDIFEEGWVSFVLTSGIQAKGETWNCSVNATDSYLGMGIPNSTTRIISNTPPEVTGVQYTPSSNIYRTTIGLNCTINATDIDGDALTNHYLHIKNDASTGIATQNVTNSTYIKNDVMICQGYVNDGSLDSNKVNSSSATILNSAPIMLTSPILNPTTIYKTTIGVNCTLGTSTDADEDALTPYFLWHKNDVSTGIATQNITNSSYAHFDSLLCQQYVSDGVNNSNKLNSSASAVLNTIPVLPILSLPTNASRVNDTTLLTINPTSDVDSDTIYYSIFGDTSVNPTALLQNTTSNTYNWTTLTRGLTYWWRAKAEDNYEASNYSAQFTFTSNSFPYITSVSITPATAYTNSTLNCSATYNDAEGDAGNVSIYWYNGSALYSSATILNVLNGNSISFVLTSGIQAKGETWNCSVNATDSYLGMGIPNSTTRTISNTPPETTGVQYTPSSNIYKTTIGLNCTINATDIDGDTLTNHYLHIKNDASTGITTQNITNSSYAHFDTLICQGYVDDGSLDSNKVNSSASAVLNTIPVLPILSLPTNNSKVNLTTLLTINPTSDVDSDTIYYSIFGDTSVNPTALLQNTTSNTYNWTLSGEQFYWWRAKA